MQKKDTKVEVRCAFDEKARWVEAAGGRRQLSAWLRALANDAAAQSNEPLLHEPVVEATKEALAPAKVSIGKTNGVMVPCRRAPYHRPGAYCAACGKVN